ncbi:sushi, von Willebrand factor type A, EGF and pentraxin domain-containing protein 1-like [Xenia sp. Carnegie-2017]|uniref:sushi, von Willebrand factor type A, EGF and pentraxin domain-containing protein 1-like n=1 Tax=Xenia sp. Carnegie-2017 TaxID=2897299 RepID=UPI001F037349|nr:sushi, von Willebrand factor type A, EGF and pentraxin domain-containing protein 1-like [Xenia sp. Carnegie-2017]
MANSFEDIIPLLVLCFMIAAQNQCEGKTSTSLYRRRSQDTCPLVKNILKEGIFETLEDCTFNCHQEVLCIGFNFINYSRQNINCQLTSSLQHKHQNCHERKWNFYQKLTTDPQVPSVMQKHCKNGGWAVLNAKNAPKSDPYKCQCPITYTGDFCEIGPRLARKFDGGNTHQYGLYVNSSKQFNAFSISFWITMSDDIYYETQEASIISYAFKQEGQVHANAPLFFILNKKTDISDIFDGKGHHIMITWQKVDGQMIIYQDGEQKDSKLVAKGQNLLAGGIWVVGQDQDTFGGGFQNSDCFKGIIDAVYIWDKVLSIDEIKLLANNCNAYLSGYSIGYHDFEFTNTTNRVEPTCSV